MKAHCAQQRGDAVPLTPRSAQRKKTQGSRPAGSWCFLLICSHFIHYLANALFFSFGKNMSVSPHPRLKSKLERQSQPGSRGGSTPSTKLTLISLPGNKSVPVPHSEFALQTEMQMRTSVCRTHRFQSSALVHFKENTQFTKMLKIFQ